MKLGDVLLFGPAVAAAALSAAFGSRMPERMVVHWNAAGQADGYVSRVWGLYGLPLLGFLLALLFLAIPRIDPLRGNDRLFEKQYGRLVTLLLLFLLAMHCYILLWNAGHRIPVSAVVTPGLAVLLFYAGHVCEHAPANRSIGVRTPWTLSHPVVWERTNRLGGRLLKAAAASSLAGLLRPELAAWFVLGPVLLTALIVPVYSYLEYRKLAGR